MIQNSEIEPNISTEYEIFTRGVYNCLLNADGYQNIGVKHNFKLPGKSGCNHQIDVYWEFKIAGDIHRVAIECKNFSKEVSIAKIRDFFGVIYDIGNVKGIFVSKKGFQSGSKLFADYYGINLKEIRKPKLDDWNSRVKTIVVELQVLPKVVTSIFILADSKWLVDKGIIKSEEEVTTLQISLSGLNSEIFVYDDKHNKLHSFLELENTLPHNHKKADNLKHAYDYENGYVECNLGVIKIKAVEFAYRIEVNSSEIIIEAEELTKAIIKDIKTGEIKFINNDGTVK